MLYKFILKISFKKKQRNLFYIFIGFFLITLNVNSSLTSLRSNSLNYQNIKKNYFAIQNTDKRISYDKAISNINQKITNKKEYVKLLNNTIHQSIIHYYPNIIKLQREYRSWIPPTENYILYLIGFMHERFRNWEFYDYKKAIKRGIGICSQFAITLDQVLKEKNIESKLVGLNGHVVATAKVADDEWWTFDPNYGVILPYSIEEINLNPSLIEKHYKKANYSQKRVNKIIEFYKSENFIGDDWYSRKQKFIYLINIAANKLKNLIPLILFLKSFTYFLKIKNLYPRNKNFSS